MQIETSRFGSIGVEPDDVIEFSSGIVGMETYRKWAWLADDRLWWLQSLDSPDVALAIVSPRQFVPDYQVCVSKRDLDAIQIQSMTGATIVAIVGRQVGPQGPTLTLNLGAPLVMNLPARLGCQVIVKHDYPFQFEIPTHPLFLKKSA